MSWGLQPWGLGPWGGVTLEPEIPVREFEFFEFDEGAGIEVRLKLRTTRTIPAPDTFVISVEVLESENIDQEIFVYDTCKRKYSHVAMVRDIDIHPTTVEKAEQFYIPFYRDKQITLSFRTPEAAVAAEATLDKRFQVLVQAWKPIVKGYPSTEILTATG